ncbi:glycosyltransferase [Clostridium perfringens]|uniref:glycosyltransferase n=1 Tax=Clostridium perfringens TaxID=1502 RepID=UPI0039E9592A
MKILQVNCVYNTGSTGKIVYDLHKTLERKGIESIVCYGRGKKLKEKNIYKTSFELISKFNNIKSRVTGFQYNGSFFATNKLINIIKKEKPDVVHLHCINGFFVNIYKLLEFLKYNNIKTVITLHAEFMYTGGCGISDECNKWMNICYDCPKLKSEIKSYFFDNTRKCWRMLKNIFEDFSELRIVSVSPWLENRARKSPILANKKHSTIFNGIDSKVFFKREYSDLKKRLGLTNERILLHVTSNFNSELKGGKYIIDLAKNLDNNIKIIVVGDNCRNEMFKENIINVGKIKDQNELAKFYSMADLTLITSKVETFSMVCAESLSCGTPVVGFKAGGPETISIKEFSSFVEYGNVDKLKKVIYKFLSNDYKEIEKIAHRIYSKEKMSNDYIKIYSEFGR